MDLSNKSQSFIEHTVTYVENSRVLTGTVCINMTLITDVCDYNSLKTGKKNLKIG